MVDLEAPLPILCERCRSRNCPLYHILSALRMFNSTHNFFSAVWFGGNRTKTPKVLDMFAVVQGIIKWFKFGSFYRANMWYLPQWIQRSFCFTRTHSRQIFATVDSSPHYKFVIFILSGQCFSYKFIESLLQMPQLRRSNVEIEFFPYLILNCQSKQSRNS